MGDSHDWRLEGSHYVADNGDSKLIVSHHKGEWIWRVVQGLRVLASGTELTMDEAKGKAEGAVSAASTNG